MIRKDKVPGWTPDWHIIERFSLVPMDSEPRWCTLIKLPPTEDLCPTCHLLFTVAKANGCKSKRQVRLLLKAAGEKK
ncbi:MAG: hypothetical protein WAV09_03430 [Minisyncoccia bacterium]